MSVDHGGSGLAAQGIQSLALHTLQRTATEKASTEFLLFPLSSDTTYLIWRTFFVQKSQWTDQKQKTTQHIYVKCDGKFDHRVRENSLDLGADSATMDVSERTITVKLVLLPMHNKKRYIVLSRQHTKDIMPQQHLQYKETEAYSKRIQVDSSSATRLANIFNGSTLRESIN